MSLRLTLEQTPNKERRNLTALNYSCLGIEHIASYPTYSIPYQLPMEEATYREKAFEELLLPIYIGLGSRTTRYLETPLASSSDSRKKNETLLVIIMVQIEFNTFDM